MKERDNPIVIDNSFVFKNMNIKDTSKIAIMRVSGNKFIRQGIIEGAYVYIEIGGEYRLNDIVLVKTENGSYNLVNDMKYGMTYIGRAFACTTSIKGGIAHD